MSGPPDPVRGPGRGCRDTAEEAAFWEGQGIGKTYTIFQDATCFRKLAKLRLFNHSREKVQKVEAPEQQQRGSLIKPSGFKLITFDSHTEQYCKRFSRGELPWAFYLNQLEVGGRWIMSSRMEMMDFITGQVDFGKEENLRKLRATLNGGPSMTGMLICLEGGGCGGFSLLDADGLGPALEAVPTGKTCEIPKSWAGLPFVQKGSVLAKRIESGEVKTLPRFGKKEREDDEKARHAAIAALAGETAGAEGWGFEVRHIDAETHMKAPLNPMLAGEGIIVITKTKNVTLAFEKCEDMTKA